MHLTGPGVPPSQGDLAKTSWHVSSFSDSGGPNCVEAGKLTDGSGRIALRHSKHPGESVILYTRAEWDAFVAGVKAGEFDFS